MTEVTNYIPARLKNAAVGGHVAGAEDIIDDYTGETLNLLSVKPATTGTTGDYPYNGLGRVILRKNMVSGVNTLTQDMFYKGEVGSRVPNTNTVFVVKYDFVLGENITIPDNCILEFDGGSVANGTITLQDTKIIHGKEKIFYNVILAGTTAGEFYITNFGCVSGTGNESVNNAALAKAFTSLDNLGSVKSYSGNVRLIVPHDDEYYYFSTPLVSAGKFDFICEGLLVYTGDTVSTALTFGNNSQVIEFKYYVIKIAQDSQRAKVSGVVPENIGVKIINLYNSKVTFDYISKFCYGIVLVGDGYGFGYNTIHLNDFGDYHYTALKLMALNDGWINQNTFFGGKVHSYTNSIYSGEDIAIHIIGTSTHVSNENTFYSQCLEGSYTAIKLEYAKDNRFVYPRYEAVTNKRVEDGNSYDNVFIGGWNNEDAGYDLNLSSRLMQMALVRRDKVKVYSNGSGGSGKASTNVCATTLYVSEYNEMQHFADAGGALIGYMVDATYCKSFFFRKSEELNFNKIYLRLFDASGNEIEFNDTTILITDYVKSRTKFRYVANYNNNVMTNANTREVYFSVVDSVKKVFIGAAGGTGTIELYAPFNTVPRVINPKENVVSFVPNATVGCEIGDRVFCTSLNKPIFIKTLDANGVPTWVDGAGNAV